MWICAQDQKVKKAVADYFSGPGQVRTGSMKPSRTGGAFDSVSTGEVPDAEKVFLGKGRDAHTRKGPGRPTKIVSDWLNTDEKASRHWRAEAARQRGLAARAAAQAREGETVESIAAQQLARQMKDEVTQEMLAQAKGLFRELAYEALASVNWLEVAEDLLAHQ
jgi:hypothetical protein